MEAIFDYMLFELILVAIVIYACVVEEKLIAFEIRLKEDVLAIRKACKRQNITLLRFLHMLFVCAYSGWCLKFNLHKAKRVHGKTRKYVTFKEFFATESKIQKIQSN